jgi:hypothetical protein
LRNLEISVQLGDSVIKLNWIIICWSILVCSFYSLTAVY